MWRLSCLIGLNSHARANRTKRGAIATELETCDEPLSVEPVACRKHISMYVTDSCMRQRPTHPTTPTRDRALNMTKSMMAPCADIAEEA